MNSGKLAMAEEPATVATSSTSSDVEGEPRTLTQWWRSDWGPGPLIQIALPLMMSTGFMSLTLFTDRTLLYWQSESSASAAMGAGALYWTISCLPLGLLGYISTFVSQYRGAGQNARVGAAYQHAMALAWMMVPIFLVLALVSSQIFSSAGHDPELVTLESRYLSILLLGGTAILFYNVQSGLLTGQGRTRIVLAVEAIATVINLVLDFVLIFGWGPIPQLGLVGAALATAISFWLKLPIMTWIIRRDSQMRDDYHVGKRVPWELSMFKRLVVYGTPSGLQMLAEAGCFSVIMLQVGRLGKLEMAATTLALGLNVLAFVPMIGLSISVGVLVGQHLTERRIDLARRTVWSAIGISICYTSIFAAALGLFPQAMASLYAWGTPAERFEVMEPMLIPLLKIIALYCILDGLQFVFVGAIKGAGDTWFVLVGTFVVSSISVVAGLIYQAYFGPSLLLWWYVIAGWVAFMALTFWLRYVQGSWESKRVIEPALV
jgi:multidrug resistance protein, MATE family